MLKILWVLRNLWAIPVGAIYQIVWLVRYFLDRKVRETYKANKIAYDKIKTIPDLIAFLNKVTYEWDGYKGLFDHNNGDIEYFSSGGDCEDTAMRAYKKLKELQYNAGLILIIGKKIGDIHADCVYKINHEYFLFNFGSPMSDVSLPKLVNNLWVKIWSKQLLAYSVVEHCRGKIM